MSDTYADFLARKAQNPNGDGFEPLWTPDWLYPFQSDLVRWAQTEGRAALFADCGLGKTPMQLVWAENVRRRTGRPVLIVTPLAVAQQTAAEAAKFGLDAAVSRDGTLPAGLVITNYERLEKFAPHAFGGVVCDESSAIKAFDGQRRALVTEFLRGHRFRLLCTATAAPNDYTELGTSSEALGLLGHMDMLNRFFVNDLNNSATGRYRGQTQKFRLKGHAEDGFWRWVASWARACRRPSDLGYSNLGYDLLPLIEREHVVDPGPDDQGDGLFDLPATSLRDERAEARRSVHQRAEHAASLLTGSLPGVAWCQLNDEADAVTRLVDGAVQVSGSQSIEEKEESLIAFASGQARVLVTKPSIGAWGLNWQHCPRMTYFPSHSYEQYYQAVRRCWRFGQERQVTVDVVTTPGQAGVLRNLRRKADRADAMFDRLILHMHDGQAAPTTSAPTLRPEVPSWAL